MGIHDRLRGLLDALFKAGPDDRVFDAFILVAPLVIAGIALLGRTTVTTSLAVSYLLVVVGYTVLLGVRHRGGDKSD